MPINHQAAKFPSLLRQERSSLDGGISTWFSRIWHRVAGFVAGSSCRASIRGYRAWNRAQVSNAGPGGKHRNTGEPLHPEYLERTTKHWERNIEQHQAYSLLW